MRESIKKLAPVWLKPFGRAVEERWIRIGRLVFPPPLPQNPDGKVLLNLGSGTVTHPAFVNVDLHVGWHIHYRRGVDDLRPFRDASVDLVYVSHCLEHIPHGRVNAVLAEWFRVLKPGGILRVGVPDFDALLKVYEAWGRDVEKIQLPLMGGQTYPLNFHFTAFTRRSLTDRLAAVGFREVREWRRGTDELTSLPDFTGLELDTPTGKILVSLNLEGVK